MKRMSWWTQTARAVKRRAVAAAADELRRQAVRRMEAYGPDDVRAAALWDAGCWIDPYDFDVLGLWDTAVYGRPVSIVRPRHEVS